MIVNSILNLSCSSATSWITERKINMKRREIILKRIGETAGHRMEDGHNFMEIIKHLRVDMLLFGHEHRHLMLKGTRLE